MKQYIGALAFLISMHTCHSMEEGTTGQLEVVDRKEHDRKVTALQCQIRKKEQKIKIEKRKQAKEIVKIHRRWDLKDAAAPSAYIVAIGIKTAYDVYSLVNDQGSSTLNLVNLCLDSAGLGYCLGKSWYHVIRACCRKAKVK